jgi:RNA polymerase sigma-70 factor (ECF subfamily)
MQFNVEDVIKSKKGDKEAFARLYESVYKDLYKMAVYMLFNKADAEDVVRETAITAYNGIGALRIPDLFGVWILRILSNKCKKKIKNITVHNEDVRIDLLNALNSLDADNRTIVVLSVISGYKSEQIGQILGLGTSTVRSKLKRSLKKMSKVLEG